MVDIGVANVGLRGSPPSSEELEERRPPIWPWFTSSVSRLS
jgi:hypothetical protein